MLYHYWLCPLSMYGETRVTLSGNALHSTPHIPTLLTVDALSVSLDGRALLQDIHLHLAAGERVCLLGPSGAGKSMLARALIGTLPLQAQVQGHVRLHGQEITSLPPAQRSAQQRVASVHQDAFHALNPLYTVGQQLMMVLQGQKRMARAAAREQMQMLLAQVELGGITHLPERYPAELSGGQRQRLCIALALASQASLLVADEPTTALDVVTQEGILETLRGFSQSASSPGLLFITHDIGVAARLCDRGLVLYEGQLVEQGQMQQLLASPQHPYTCQMAVAAQAHLSEVADERG